MEITTTLVKKMIDTQFPEWSNLEVRPVAKSGHDNRTFHLGNKMVVRLPSGPDYVPQVEKEARWLPFLAKYLSLPISNPIAVGKSSEDYPFIWSVNSYLDGETVNEDNISDKSHFAKELASFLRELQSIDTTGAPEAGEHNFFRGASPEVYSHQVYAALEAHKHDLPTGKFRIVWEQAISSKWEHLPVWIHGDVAPGNLLVKNGSLCGVIDFGIMGVGDPACDYAMAWTFFDEKSRKCFLQGLDKDTVDRARGWALWKALITYTDTNKTVAENANHTLNEILTEFDKSYKGENIMNTPTIETERLILRKFTEDDMEALFLILKDEEVNKFLPWYPMKDLEETKKFYEERYAAKYAEPQAYAYAICLKEDNYPIGYIKVDMEEHHDFGYALRKEFWHKGIVSEAAKAVVCQVKKDGLPYITATHDRNNPRSGHVMEVVGMKYCYTYEEQWQPKDITVFFRMYQLNFDGNDERVYKKYWNMYENHFIEELSAK